MVDSTDTPPYFAGTPPSNPSRNPNFFAPGAGRNIPSKHEISHKTPTISFTSPSQLLQYVYATGSPAERYMSCQTMSSKLGLMQLERLGAHLSIFFLLATSVENEEYEDSQRPRR